MRGKPNGSDLDDRSTVGGIASVAGPAMAETELSMKDVDALKKTVKWRLSTLNRELSATENVEATDAVRKKEAVRTELLFLEGLLDRLSRKGWKQESEPWGFRS